MVVAVQAAGYAKKKKCSDLQLNIKLDSTLEEMQPYVILQ